MLHSAENKPRENKLGEQTYVSKIWNFKFRIFNSKLIDVYSCEGLGLCIQFC